MTATVSGTSSAATVLNPVNSSIATTSTPSLNVSACIASHALNADIERPSAMANRRAGRCHHGPR